MHYKVFYFFERSGGYIGSNNALEMSVKDIREQLLPRMHSADDYLGLIDARDNVLQILNEAGGTRRWVELPVEAAKASFGRFMLPDEVDRLLETLPRIFDSEQIPGMEYRPW